MKDNWSMNTQRQWEAPLCSRKWLDLHILLYKNLPVNILYTLCPFPYSWFLFNTWESLTLLKGWKRKVLFNRFKFSSKTTNAPHGGGKHPQIYVANMWQENWVQIYDDQTWRCHSFCPAFQWCVKTSTQFLKRES